MFDHLFENRNTTVTNLLKLSDCLGRSLRENVELFSIDSESNSVAYLSESGKVISGEYDFSNEITLNNIKVQESDIFTDNKIFDTAVNEKVSSFIGTLNSNKLLRRLKNIDPNIQHPVLYMIHIFNGFFHFLYHFGIKRIYEIHFH